MAFKRGNLKDLSKFQILEKLCDESLDMPTCLFKINEIHQSQCDTLLSRVTALIKSYIGVFPQNWCGVDIHCRKYRRSPFSPGLTTRVGSRLVASLAPAARAGWSREMTAGDGGTTLGSLVFCQAEHPFLSCLLPLQQGQTLLAQQRGTASFKKS